MHQIKKHLPNLKFNIASSIYLTGAAIVTLKCSSFFQDRVFSILSLLLSITFLFCAYQNKKTTFNKMIENHIIKWIFTVCVFSICLWYSKHKLNFDYDINVEYLNYSAYCYAFAMTIPLCLFIYGMSIFIHAYLGRITPYQYFYATIMALPLFYLLKSPIENQHGANFILWVGLILVLPYGFFILANSIRSANGKNKCIFSILKEKTLSIIRIKIILKILFKKSLATVSNYLRITELLSIAVALLYVGVFSIGIIPEHQRTFLLLDSFSKTDCNDKKDSFLYLRKSNSECYRITSNGVEITKMESFYSTH